VGSTGAKALIDTGSPRTVFPRGIGDLLAVEFPTLAFECPKKIQLMGREWRAVTETVQLMLRPFEDFDWDAEVDFVFDEGLQFGLLGWEGFLNRWSVSLNGYLGYVIIEPAEDFHDRQDPELFADLRERWPNL
jgi:hypothetical protein